MFQTREAVLPPGYIAPQNLTFRQNQIIRHFNHPVCSTLSLSQRSDPNSGVVKARVEQAALADCCTGRLTAIMWTICFGC